MKRVIEEDEESNKKRKSSDDVEAELDIKKFRDGLKKGNFFDDLKMFIKKAAQSSKIISKLIKSGGGPLEIVEIIKSNEDSSSDVISNLYEMLKMVILQMAEEESSTDAIVDALKCLVRKNISSLDAMLSSSKATDKIIIFELFTIGVTFRREIGREVLKNVSFFSKADVMTSSLAQIRNLRNDKALNAEYMAIRKAFVRMMFAFIKSEEDIMLTKKIVQKSALFEFFLEDLHLDTSNTIREIIACLHKGILFSTAFNKPEKLKIFTDNAVKALLKIYEWKNKDASREKELVIECVHDFLVALLANKKNGIACKALSEQRQNLRQSHVIGHFKALWMHEYPSKLVIEIIKACPDLMQNLLNRLANGLQPKVNMQWFMCANFTNSLLCALEPSVLITQFSMLEAKKVSSNIIKLSISQFILQNLNESALIQDSLEMREMATQLLEIMLKRCCQYIQLLHTETSLKDFERHRIKFDIINHIFTFYPHVDVVLNSLYRSINSPKGKTVEGQRLVKSQLKGTLNILLLLVEHFPSVIEKIPSVIDFLDVLRPIYEYQQQNNPLTNDPLNNQDELEIEMKISKIILYTSPEILSTKPELLNKIFLMLIQVYIHDVNLNQSLEARNLLISILQQNYKFFSVNTLEVIIWMESFRLENRDVLKAASMIFVKALQSKDQDVTTDEEISPILSRILALDSNKLNRVMEFIERAILLFNLAYPEKRKLFIKLVKASNVNLSTTIHSCLKNGSNALNEVAQRDLFVPYSSFQNIILSDAKLLSSELEKYCKNQDVSLLLIVQIISNAMIMSTNGQLTEAKIDKMASMMTKSLEFISTLEKDDVQQDNFEDEEEEKDETLINKIFRFKTTKTSQLVVSFIFEHQKSLLDKFSVIKDVKYEQINNFIEKLVDTFSKVHNFKEKSQSYRSKIVAEFAGSQMDMENINSAIMKFPLDDENCLEIIDSYVKNKKKIDLEFWTFLLNCLTSVKDKALSTQQVLFLEKNYLEYVENDEEVSSNFEGSLLKYINIFPHNIKDFSSKLFERTCTMESTSTRRSFVSLIQVMFRSNASFDEIFKKHFRNMRKELTFPLFSVALLRESLSFEELKSIFQKDYKSPILKAIERPKKAANIYREFIDTTLRFIEIGMSSNECSDLAMKKFKFDGSEVFQLKILHKIFSRALTAAEKDKDKCTKISANFINHWLKLFELSSSLSLNDVDEYARVINAWLKETSEYKVNVVDIENLEKVFKICLKNGLKAKEFSIMLATIGKVLAVVDIEPSIITNMFDLLLTHSNFYSVAFNTRSTGKSWKRDVFYLFDVLVQKNPKVASEKHLPILLSSYNATMSSCDQLILKLLQFYEQQCNVDFYGYRPLMFGAAALSHFSSAVDTPNKDFTLTKKSLDTVDASCQKLMDSFENSLIETTINNFPIHRKLKNDEDKSDALEDGEIVARVYDPAFYLPLFDMILSTTSFDFTTQSIKNNTLLLVPTALSCEDEKMRLLAATVLLKCRQQTENKKLQKEMWIKFYDGIQKGLYELKDDSKANVFPRAPLLVTRMLTEFIRVLSSKLHNAHHLVCNFLIIKEKMDLWTLPEYMILFQSSFPENEEHRLFLLDVIFNGIRDHLDIKVLNNTPMLRMLLSSYGCPPLSTRKTDFMILKIFDRLMATENGMKLMLEKHGFAVWLFQLSVKVEAFEYDTIEMILTIISNIASKKDIKDENSKILMKSLLKLLPKLTTGKISPKLLTSILVSTNKLGQFRYIQNNQLELILEVMGKHLSKEQSQSVKYLSQHPEICDSKYGFSATQPHEDNIFNEIKQLFVHLNSK